MKIDRCRNGSGDEFLTVDVTDSYQGRAAFERTIKKVMDRLYNTKKARREFDIWYTKQMKLKGGGGN